MADVNVTIVVCVLDKVLLLIIHLPNLILYRYTLKIYILENLHKKIYTGSEHDPI